MENIEASMKRKQQREQWDKEMEEYFQLFQVGKCNRTRGN